MTLVGYILDHMILCLVSTILQLLSFFDVSSIKHLIVPLIAQVFYTLVKKLLNLGKIWEENQTQYTLSPSCKKCTKNKLKDQLVKKFLNFYNEWWKKTERLLKTLFMKKSLNPKEKCKKKIEDEGKCKLSVKKSLNN